MSLKLKKNSFLQSLIVGLCDTKIGGCSSILTNNTHRDIETKLAAISADFFSMAMLADFFGR